MKNWLEITLNFIEDDNCNQNGFLNNKLSLSQIFKCSNIINDYLREGDIVDISYLDFRNKNSVLGTLLFLVFINNLSNDIKSEIKLFAHIDKLKVRPLSKETTKVGLNRLSY